MRDTPPSNLFYQTRRRRPLVKEARGVFIRDESGRRYIDATSGAMVSNIGHGNAHVLEAMRAQMEKATFTYRLHFENEPAEQLARLTASKMPEGLDRVFFVSGGSEAVESAAKLARRCRRRVRVAEASRFGTDGPYPPNENAADERPRFLVVGGFDQARSKRSAFMTFVQAATKSLTNFPPLSLWA